MYINLHSSIKLLFLIQTTNCLSFQLFSTDPDIDRNATQLIESRGFIPEVHRVLTRDGYILALYRIVNPRLSPGLRGQSYPMYLQYGFIGNTEQWLVTSGGTLLPNGTYVEDNGIVNDCSATSQSVALSLPYVLSACGYDVWLGNWRGTEYSSHIVLNNLDPRYWSFSLDHYSQYDITANLQYVLSRTKSETVGYIGYSLGNSVLFQLLSREPEYSQVIKPFISLGTFCYLQHIRSPLLRLFDLFLPILRSADFRIGGFGPLQSLFGRYFCGNSILKQICVYIYFLIGGFDVQNLNESMMPRLYAHFPDGTSSMVGAHLGQRIRHGNYSMFDYGPVRNNEVYGQNYPPNYDISRIDSKYIVMMSALNDYLSDVEDDNTLRSQLNVTLYGDYVVPDTQFTHGDFIYGNSAGRYVNAKILRVLESLNLNSEQSTA